MSVTFQGASPGAASLRERIERDLRDEARGRDALDYLVPGRIAAGLRRELILSNRPARPICHVGAVVSDPPSAVDFRNRVDTRYSARDNRRLIDAGAAAYDAVCANLTGSILPDSAFEKLRARRVQQNAKSIELARALESTGRFEDRPFFYGENHPDSVTVIGLESGAVVPIPALRRVNFFPAIAAGNRAKMLRDVEHFIACHPRRSRMYTMTRGPRVAIHRVTLRRDFSAFNRRLSKLAHKLRKELGVSMQWAGNELGSPEWVDGQMTVHLHAHILVTEPESMNPKKRAKIRRKIWRLVTNHTTGEKAIWDDAGEIQNAREFVKYPVKDADLDKILREAGPGVLADLYEALRGMKICRPMGELRRIRGERRKSARRITAFNRHDGRCLEETADWNAAKRPLAGPKRHKAELKKRACELRARLAAAEYCRRIGSTAADSGDGETAHSAHLTPIAADSDDDDDARESSDDYGPRGPQLGQSEKTGEKATSPTNRVIARLAPAPYGGPICEPAVVVWGFNGDVAAVLAQSAVVAIRERHARAYAHAQDARALIRACADAQARAVRAASEGLSLIHI